MFCRGLGRSFLGGGFGTSSLAFGFMSFMMLVKFLILIGVVFFAVRLLIKHNSGSKNVLRLLDERFARGELTEEEYIKRKTILNEKI